jgi:hypothetical protein
MPRSSDGQARAYLGVEWGKTEQPLRALLRAPGPLRAGFVENSGELLTEQVVSQRGRTDLPGPT